MRTFATAWRRLGLAGPEHHVLVAVSGGADSVGLLRLLAALPPAQRPRLTVAHLHHGLRGRAADEDAVFVRELAESLGLPCVTGRARVARRAGVSIEMAARAARYRFLSRTARRVGASAVATGHTADDQAETLLLRLARGSGLDGLAGMIEDAPVQGVRVVRPLLGFTHAHLEAYCRRMHQPWREDASNREEAHRRNRVRHEVLPLLEARLNPAVRPVLARTAGVLAGEAAWLAHEAAGVLGACRLPGGALDLAALGRAAAGRGAGAAAVSRRVTRDWLLAQRVPAEALDLDLVERVLGLGPGRHTAVDGRRCVWREGDVLRVRPGREPALPDGTEAVRLRVPGATHVPVLAVTVTATLEPGVAKPRGSRPGRLPARASLHPDLAARPLTIRGWRPGDRLHPFGMRGSRKLQDILTDAHVPVARRPLVPVILCGETIVWVPGYRVAAAAAVTDPAGPCLQLRIGRAGPR